MVGNVTSRSSVESLGPASYGFAVTPSDSSNFAVNARSLFVGTGGDVVAVMLDGTAITFKSVPSGTFMPIWCSRVNSTNTTASNIVGLR